LVRAVEKLNDHVEELEGGLVALEGVEGDAGWVNGFKIGVVDGICGWTCEEVGVVLAKGVHCLSKFEFEFRVLFVVGQVEASWG